MNSSKLNTNLTAGVRNMPFVINTVYCGHESEEACIAHIEICAKANPTVKMNYHHSEERGWRTFWDLEEFVDDKDFSDESLLHN